ncbi:drug/metabolite transporter (DMT)-like permease [Natronospira proteinivora]|uniref:Drug/metabolite transporter (DMT)-like permease n=1 Tax=Natronospira proteinivora TaxID=1807133 RepID=A0ABT1GAB5_9GAMM|nr:EamA family transporter [Natronospira proteinivora]MCP1728276.1 drug/metabolite transporter (DMT)-like permease [Natronospira proteinivora]
MSSQPPWLAKLGLFTAFALICLIWGSTFMAIRIGVQDLPPALMAGFRFLIAAGLLGLVALAFGQRPRGRADWLAATIMGLLLVAAGNGLVTWAEQWVPSNQAALLITTGAMWITLFGSLGPNGHRITPRIGIGLVVGLAGAAMMLAPQNGLDLQYLWAQIVILASSVGWALGTTYRRNIKVKTGPLMFAAMQMFTGGLILTVIGLAAGELSEWQWTAPGIGAMAYLTIFGSCIAYAFYVWLIDRTTPARLGATAYIVPAIATVLGWWLLDETLQGIQFIGVFVIIVGVILVTTPARRRRSAGD